MPDNATPQRVCEACQRELGYEPGADVYDRNPGTPPLRLCMTCFNNLLKMVEARDGDD